MFCGKQSLCSVSSKMCVLWAAIFLHCGQSNLLSVGSNLFLLRAAMFSFCEQQGSYPVHNTVCVLWQQCLYSLGTKDYILWATQLLMFLGQKSLYFVGSNVHVLQAAKFLFCGQQSLSSVGNKVYVHWEENFTFCGRKVYDYWAKFMF